MDTSSRVARFWKQPLPYAVQIELVEGCNLRCSFCGINGIRGQERTYRYMELATARSIASSFRLHAYHGRIEFAMHGEPSLHKRAAAIISILRRAAPKAYMMMLTNGGGLVRTPGETLGKLFAAGLNTVGIDEYQGIDWAAKVLSALGNPPDGSEVALGRLRATLWRYPANKAGNPHRRVRERRLVHIAPIDTASEGTHATLNNHCGAGAPLDMGGAGKRCAKPFREISVRWDGSVALCCNDWRGVLPIGNASRADLLSGIWNSPAMQAARRKLYHGERDFGPCLGCNATSYRPGLLPDAKGLVSLPRATASDDRLIEAAIAKGPLTAPVLRPWERDGDRR